MRIGKFAAVAMMVVAGTAVFAGTAYAGPAAIQSAPAPAAVRGVDHGVRYTDTVDMAHRVIVATIDSGHFVRTGGDRAVGLADARGHVVAALPTAIDVVGHALTLVANIGPSGRTLTLTPVAAPGPGPHDLQHDWNHPSQGEVFGGIVGAFLGGWLGDVIGLLIGALFFLVGAPFGAVIGGATGSAMGLQAGFNYGGQNWN